MKPKGEKFEMRQVAAKSIDVDHRFQRAIIPSRVAKLAERMDLDSLGVLVVSERKKGVFTAIDGQHRVAALMQLGLGDWEVLCRVYSGLTPEKEAELFRQLNDTRRITSWDDFKAGLVSGDDSCTAIRDIAKATGWEVSNFVGHGKVCCVSTLRTLYQKDAKALGKALEDAQAAWGDNPLGFEKAILGGLALIHQSYNGELDRPAFIKKLAKVQGGPAQVIGHARQLASIKSAPIARLCGEVMVAHYNHGRRQGQLPPL